MDMAWMQCDIVYLISRLKGVDNLFIDLKSLLLELCNSTEDRLPSYLENSIRGSQTIREMTYYWSSYNQGNIEKLNNIGLPNINIEDRYYKVILYGYLEKDLLYNQKQRNYYLPVFIDLLKNIDLSVTISQKELVILMCTKNYKKMERKYPNLESLKNAEKILEWILRGTFMKEIFD